MQCGMADGINSMGQTRGRIVAGELCLDFLMPDEDNWKLGPSIASRAEHDAR